jgi:hypothetical protein
MEDALQKFISVNENLMKKLRSKRDEVEDHQKRCLVAKTVGTSSNTVGTTMAVIGVLGAPFTGGASLAFTVGGLAATGVGVVTNVVTDVVDSSATKEFAEQIEDILKVRDQVLRELAYQLEAVAKKVERGMAAGLTHEISLMMAFVATGTGTLRILKPGLTVLLAQRALDVSVELGIIRALPKVVDALKPGMASIGLKPSATLLSLSGKVIGAAAKGLAAVGVAVQVWEIKNLVEAWQTNHPTVEAIDDIVKQLREEITSCEELLQGIQKIKEDQILQPIEQLAPVIATKALLQSEVEPVMRNFREDPHDYLKLVEQSCLRETGEDIRKLTESLLVYALVIDAVGDGQEFYQEWRKIEHKTGNKKKTKVRLQELLKSILKKAEDAWKESKEKDRKKKRGDHVINLGVLGIYPDIIAQFMVQHRLDQYLGRIPDGSAILLDRTNPVGAEAGIIKRMVVFLDENRPPDVNAAVYGRTVEMLIDTCLNHMTEIYHNPSLGRTSRYTAMIRELVNQMVTQLIFVDQPARDRWCATGAQNARDYERAKNAVIYMFQRLHDKLSDWVRALRNARDGT